MWSPVTVAAVTAVVTILLFVLASGVVIRCFFVGSGVSCPFLPAVAWVGSGEEEGEDTWYLILIAISRSKCEYSD